MNLAELILSIKEDELLDINRKIYSEDVESLRDFLPAAQSRNDLINILYQEIDKLPIVLLAKLMKFRDAFLKDELESPGKNFSIIVNNIVRLSSKYNFNLNYSVILKFITGEIVNDRIKLKLAIYLSNIEAINSGIFEELIEKYQFLLPAIVNRFKYSDPFLALTYLDKYLYSADSLMIRPTLRLLLQNLLSIDTFNPSVYWRYTSYYENANPSTQEMLNQILSLPELKAINDKLNYYRFTNLQSEKEEYFSSGDLYKANLLVSDIMHNRPVIQEDVIAYNVHALVFVILGQINNDQRKISMMGRLFHEFNEIYEEKFHAYLRKYSVKYEPYQHGIYFGDNFYVFLMKPEIFQSTQNDLMERYSGVKRINALKQLAQEV